MGRQALEFFPINLHTCQGTNLCQLVQRTLLFRIVRMCVRVSVCMRTPRVVYVHMGTVPIYA